MRQVWVRLAEVPTGKINSTNAVSDIPAFIEFMRNSADINLFDPSIMNSPTTDVLCAFGETGPLMFTPRQRVVCVESLAPRPGLSPREEALALRETMKVIVYDAQKEGIGEVMFACTDERVIEFAKNNGFEEVPYKFLRLKVQQLEVPKQDAVEK